MNLHPTTPITPLRPRFSLARLVRLTHKELCESLRDRRTLLTLVLMPILLYPLLGLVYLVYFRLPLEEVREAYQIGVLSESEGKLLSRDLYLGEEVLRREQGFLPAAEHLQGQAQKPEPHLEHLPALKTFLLDDIEQDVLKGRVDVGVRLLSQRSRNQQGGGARQAGTVLVWEAHYREDSPRGREAVRHLQRLVSASAIPHLHERLKGLSSKPDGPLSSLRVQPLSNPHAPRYPLLGALVPLVLVLMTITGAVYPAIDLTAGERERGTLEILMAAPVPRVSILLAKYLTVLTVALLTALVNLAMMTATVLVLGVGPGLFLSGPRMVLVMVEVLALLVLLAAFFSAVLLALTSLARSFKEAQAYLIPLMLVAITPGLLGLLPELKLEGGYLWVPLLNIVLLSRDLLTGGAAPLPAVAVVLITAAYAVAALFLAARVFGRAAVPDGEDGWLSRVFRRLEGQR